MVEFIKYACREIDNDNYAEMCAGVYTDVYIIISQQ